MHGYLMLSHGYINLSHSAPVLDSGFTSLLVLWQSELLHHSVPHSGECIHVLLLVLQIATDLVGSCNTDDDLILLEAIICSQSHQAEVGVGRAVFLLKAFLLFHLPLLVLGIIIPFKSERRSIFILLPLTLILLSISYKTLVVTSTWVIQDNLSQDPLFNHTSDIHFPTDAYIQIPVMRI